MQSTSRRTYCKRHNNIVDMMIAIAYSYEVQLVKSTGTDPSGPALDVLHTISVVRSWTLTQSTGGTKSFTGTMTIREIADTVNSVSASVTITADRSDLKIRIIMATQLTIGERNAKQRRTESRYHHDEAG